MITLFIVTGYSKNRIIPWRDYRKYAVMNIPSITVFLTLIPLAWIFRVLWRERNQFHSLTPYIIGALCITLARLLDVPVEVQSIPVPLIMGMGRPLFDTIITVVSDAADFLGLSFLVAGFIGTLHSLHSAEQHVKNLEQLLPMCAWCRRIKSPEGAWEPIERYLHDHGGPEVSHGVCPECATRLKADFRRSRDLRSG
jgi:hypothetical protein